jgi:fatty-acyl-CoA synthase
MNAGGDDLLLGLAFDRAARSHPDAAAFVDGAASVTYAQLHARAEAHARHLRTALAGTDLAERDHPGAGDCAVVALVAVDPLSTLEWLFGALRVGVAVVPITPAGPDRYAQLRMLRPDITVSCVPDARIDRAERTETHASGLAPIGAHRLPAGLPPAGVIVCTAGTTGAPKAVVHTHASLGHAVRRLQLFREESIGNAVGRVPADEHELRDDLLDAAAAPALGLRYATTLPLTTMGGLTVAFQALLAGESLVLPSTADPRTLIDAVAIAGVTNLSLTPFVAQLVARAAKTRPGAPRSSLLFVGIGGGPVVRELPADLEAAIGCPVAVGYGTTESGGAITMGRISDPADVRHHTVGRPLPGIELSADPETHALVLKCASNALGFITETRAFTELDRDAGPTGDLGRLRPDGALELCGRRDALILRGGRNIDPVRVERTLEAHPAVQRAAAFGVANPSVSGEQDIWAVVVLDRAVDEAELRSHCNRELGASLTPLRVTAVDALPLTADGAVRRPGLADLARGQSTRGQFTRSRRTRPRLP